MYFITRYLFISLLIIGLVLGYSYIASLFQYSAVPSFSQNVDFTLNPIVKFKETYYWTDYDFEGLKFQYPYEWDVKTQTKENPDAVLFTKFNDFGPNGRLLINLNKMNSSFYFNCKAYIESIKPYNELSGIKVELAEDTSFRASNLEGRILLTNENTMEGPTKNLYLCFPKDNQSFTLQIKETGKGRDFKSLQTLIDLLNTIQ